MKKGAARCYPSYKYILIYYQLYMVLQFPLHHHHHHDHRQDYGMPRHGFLAGSPQWRNVMHMSILNALPASMTLAPLNDVNNGRQAASMVAWMVVRRQEEAAMMASHFGGSCNVHWHDIPLYIPIPLIHPQFIFAALCDFKCIEYF